LIARAAAKAAIPADKDEKSRKKKEKEIDKTPGQ
jgi:hypothetical protein